MKAIAENEFTFVLLDESEHIGSVNDALDIMASASYNYDCDGIIVQESNFDRAFFDLKTGLAGAILQKFSNYKMKLAIIGDFSNVSSKSLRDFIYECNKGKLVFFKENIDKAIQALSKADPA